MRKSQPFLRWCQWACLVGALIPMSGCRSGSGISRVPGFGWLAKDDDLDRNGWASYADGPTSLAEKEKDSADDAESTKPSTTKSQESKSELKVAQKSTETDTSADSNGYKYPTTKTPDPYPGTSGSAAGTSGTPLATAGSAGSPNSGTQDGFYTVPAEPAANPAPSVAQASVNTPSPDGPPPFIPSPPPSGSAGEVAGTTAPPYTPATPPAYTPPSAGDVPAPAAPPAMAGSDANPFGTLPPPPGPASAMPAGPPESGRAEFGVADNRGRMGATPPAGTSSNGSTTPTVPGETYNPYVTPPAAAPGQFAPTTPAFPATPPTAAAPAQTIPRSTQPWTPGSTGRSLTPTPTPQQNPWGAAPSTTPPGTTASPMVPGRLSQRAIEGATILAVSDEFPARQWR